MNNGILVIGGTGKTGRHVAAQLAARGVPARVATRTPSAATQVRFDWHDPRSFDQALEGTTAIYMVAPADTLDVLSAMTPFMERALAAGVGPLVLLSASTLEPGGPMMGAVHQWLIDNAPNWTALRPTWFMQNFLDDPHRHTILSEGRIYTATQDGRVGFIDADDIARVAVKALTTEELKNRDVVLTGPESLSYGDVAALIVSATGRPVTHEKLDIPGLAARHETAGLPPEYAYGLAATDGEIADGTADWITEEVEKTTGYPPRSFAAFAKDNADAWRNAI